LCVVLSYIALKILWDDLGLNLGLLHDFIAINLTIKSLPSYVLIQYFYCYLKNTVDLITQSSNMILYRPTSLMLLRKRLLLQTQMWH